MLRKFIGFPTFDIRPHCGENCGVDHLIIGFLAVRNTSHGILLGDFPVQQYLFYLAQVTISDSVLSYFFLYVYMSHHPFLKYFSQGLKVKIATDDPFIFHLVVNQPLIAVYQFSSY